MPKLANREKQAVRSAIKFILSSDANKAYFSEGQLELLKTAGEKYGMKERAPQPRPVQLYEVIGRKLDLSPKYMEELKEILETFPKS